MHSGYNYRVRAQDSGSLLFTIDGMLFEDAQTRDMMDATGRPILTLRRRPESDGFKIDGLDSDRAHLYATKPVIKYASFGKHHVDQTWSAQIKVQDRCAPNSTVEGERFYLHLESVRDHTRAEIFDSQRQLVASIEAPLDGEVTMAVVVGADLALMAAIGVIYKDKAILRQHDRQRKWVNGDLCTGRVENCARCRGTKPVSSSVGISHKA
ncbi:hypothetical protein OC846_004511 [Tilletia horrida]|uniref:Uncharacterized protein n=1 Tax=Tilletia horrida TaxID=155126 RepID=A0AAN6JWW6_9BASI|nr:hypothetical protein OC846_004511 [Tilletia horrida]